VHSPEDAAVTSAAAAADSAQIAALHVSLRHRKGSRHHGASASAGSGSHHVVQKGETLSQIARKYGISVSELRRANHLQSDVVRSGQRLRLPA
jgi:LysM repeat protein